MSVFCFVEFHHSSKSPHLIGQASLDAAFYCEPSAAQARHLAGLVSLATCHSDQVALFPGGFGTSQISMPLSGLVLASQCGMGPLSGCCFEKGTSATWSLSFYFFIREPYIGTIVREGLKQFNTFKWSEQFSCS